MHFDVLYFIIAIYNASVLTSRQHVKLKMQKTYYELAFEVRTKLNRHMYDICQCFLMNNIN